MIELMKEIENIKIENEYDIIYRNKIESLVLKNGTEEQYLRVVQLVK